MKNFNELFAFDMSGGAVSVHDFPRSALLCHRASVSQEIFQGLGLGIEHFGDFK